MNEIEAKLVYFCRTEKSLKTIRKVFMNHSYNHLIKILSDLLIEGYIQKRKRGMERYYRSFDFAVQLADNTLKNIVSEQYLKHSMDNRSSNSSQLTLIDALKTQ